RYVDLDIKPSITHLDIPTPTHTFSPHIGGAPLVITANHDDPPEAEHFDPLEHENKLNEPAPRIDHDKLNSDATRLNQGAIKSATTSSAQTVTSDPNPAHVDENFVGADAGNPAAALSIPAKND
ncbi:hypothetical protein GGH99_002558, partial [Coemansia sp. RSA 1285]